MHIPPYLNIIFYQYLKYFKKHLSDLLFLYAKLNMVQFNIESIFINTIPKHIYFFLFDTTQLDLC